MVHKLSSMKPFLDDNFLLNSGTAEQLYHDYAAEMPILDYHCHLPPGEIAHNRKFENLTRAWLAGDHYKWRAMRTNGIDEKFITGNTGDEEKFERWAATVPYTMRNPLYHWTHLELRRYFGITDLLNSGSATKIYHSCSEMLQQPDYSVRGLLQKMKVKLVCTTDDPLDSLEHHQLIKKETPGIVVLPAFRPDAAMQADDIDAFTAYLGKLEIISGKNISSYNDFLDALKMRHDFFARNGCSVSDHGLEEIYAEPYSEKEISAAFLQLRNGNAMDPSAVRKFKSALLETFATWDHDAGWVQQFHLGAMRNNNSRMKASLGPDTGWDSIGDLPQAKALSVFLNRLDKQNKLAKTILYNLNPADNAVMATMTGNFNDGSFAGKIQWGSAWWFLDQLDGMEQQLNTLSNMGLISRFIGMLTDSRSFLSFPRHEYFRRLLCNLFGDDIEQGKLPDDLPWIGGIIRDICYHNAVKYFNWPQVAAG